MDCWMFFQATGVEVMLGRRVCQDVYKMFCIAAAFIDFETGYTDNFAVTDTRTACFDLVNVRLLYRGDSKLHPLNTDIKDLREFRERATLVFGSRKRMNLCTLNISYSGPRNQWPVPFWRPVFIRSVILWALYYQAEIIYAYDLYERKNKSISDHSRHRYYTR